MTPTNLSIALLESRGWIACVVERRIARCLSKDAFGFGDILAAKTGSAIVLVQTTSAGNVGARIMKIKLEPLAKKWIRAGGAIVVHGWKRRDGKPFAREIQMTLDADDNFQTTEEIA